MSTSVIFIPTNCNVHGINSPSPPLWNSIDVCVLGKIARLCFATIDDVGKFIAICTPSMQQMVLDVAGAAGWEYDHTTVTICKTPICQHGEMWVRSLLVTVWRKPEADSISRPQRDTWFDTIESADWTTDEHGQPLRGKKIKKLSISKC